MATHSSILAWNIPWTEEPGGLQSIGPQSWTPLVIKPPPPPIHPGKHHGLWFNRKAFL